MAELVVISRGMVGQLNMTLELSRRLTEVGHNVTYVSHLDLARYVEPEGHRFLQLESPQALRQESECADEALRTARPTPAAIVRWMRTQRTIRRRSIDDDELEQLLRRLHPELLIIDIEMHVAVVRSAALEIPTVLTMPFLSIFRRPGLPPLHTSLLPPTSARDRLAIEIAWSRAIIGAHLQRWRRRLSRGGIAARFRPVDPGTVDSDSIAVVARARGYDLRRNIDRTQWLRPHLYRGLPTLSLNARELDFPHDPAPGLVYVGPLVLNSRVDAALGSAEIDAWKHAVPHREGGRQLVYCSLGSHWDPDEGFLSRVVDVFRRRDDWQLVIGLGATANAEDLGPIPSNVVVFDYAPQAAILAEADCAITHGGIATINECVAHGVPMVVYSTHHVDQDGDAARVGFHGLGVVGEILTDSSHEIETLIERALTDSSIRMALDEMGEYFARYERDQTAVRLIEGFLAGVGRPPSSAAHAVDQRHSTRDRRPDVAEADRP